MILIADSGSTKTAWYLIDEKGEVVQSVLTAGINPFYQTEEQIREEINVHVYPSMQPYEAASVFFYGAGCVPEKKEIVQRALQFSFAYAQIEINSDLIGAARAMCGNTPGIVSILGTGSNSCFYDGQAPVKQVPSLGFILGDEGSGAMLGKLFISDCLKNQTDKEIKEIFEAAYGLTTVQILDKVYKQPFPNRFLASFAPFLAAHINNKSVHNIVYNAFEAFVNRNIKQYHYRQYPLHFVGSIAFYFQSVLQEVIQKNDMQLGEIVLSPMEKLVNYHIKK